MRRQSRETFAANRSRSQSSQYSFPGVNVAAQVTSSAFVALVDGDLVHWTVH